MILGEDELYAKTAHLLSLAYRRVDWRKMTSVKRPAADIMAHRVKVAANLPTVPQFLDKLCHGLHLQSVAAEPEDIALLEQNRGEVLRMLREETVYLVLLGQKEARERFTKDDADIGNEQTVLGD